MSVLQARYHVPRNQVYAGSRGRQSGNTHLHVTEYLVLGRIKRAKGRALCGRSGWYERAPEYDSERQSVCPRCNEIATKNGLQLPEGITA